MKNKPSYDMNIDNADLLISKKVTYNNNTTATFISRAKHSTPSKIKMDLQKSTKNQQTELPNPDETNDTYAAGDVALLNQYSAVVKVSRRLILPIFATA